KASSARWLASFASERVSLTSAKVWRDASRNVVCTCSARSCAADSPATARWCSSVLRRSVLIVTTRPIANPPPRSTNTKTRRKSSSLWSRLIWLCTDPPELPCAAATAGLSAPRKIAIDMTGQTRRLGTRIAIRLMTGLCHLEPGRRSSTANAPRDRFREPHRLSRYASYDKALARAGRNERPPDDRDHPTGIAAMRLRDHPAACW